MTENLSSNQWKAIEEKLSGEYEPKKRSLVADFRQIARQLKDQGYNELTLQSLEQENPQILAQIINFLAETKGEEGKTSGEILTEGLLSINEELKNLDKEITDNKPMTALINHRWNSLFKAVKAYADLETKIDDIKKKLQAFKSMKNEGKRLTGILKKKESSNVKELFDLRTEMRELLESSPEAWYGLNLKKVLEKKKTYDRTKFFEFDYLEDFKNDFFTNLNTGYPMFLYGEHGTGKTTTARKLCDEYLGDREDLKEEEKTPFFISGSKHIKMSELWGQYILTVSQSSEDKDIITKMRDEMLTTMNEERNKLIEKYKQTDPDFRNNSELMEKFTVDLRLLENAVDKATVSKYLDNKDSQGTVSKFILGPIYEAARQGRPVIIDEGNAIPDNIRISMNDILTAKPGDIITPQHAAGMESFPVKKGFCVIFTGNMKPGGDPEEYKDRYKFDPAFGDRIDKIHMGYPPQTELGLMTDEKKGIDNELFKFLSVRLMDKKGNISLPQGSLEKVWNLCRAHVFTIQAASGEGPKIVLGSGQPPIDIKLEGQVLTPRGIMKIIDLWLADDEQKELDYYVFKVVIEQATEPVERWYLFQMLKTYCNFFQSPGWESFDIPYDKALSGDTIVYDIKGKKKPQNLIVENEFFGPRQVIDMMYGKGPERTEWPELKDEDAQKRAAELAFREKRRELMEFAQTIESRLQTLESEINDFCAELDEQPNPTEVNA